jgi:hypothetical protein
MTQNTPPPGLPGLPGNLPIQGVPAPGSQNKPVEKSDGKSGVAFRALIDKLQEQANELSLESDAVEGPDELAGAVEKAGASLRDALSLGDQLLEAFRESMHRTDTADDPDAAGEPGA